MLLLLAGPAAPPRPMGGPWPRRPFTQCDAAIVAATLPRRCRHKLLPAIARVESGRLDPATGRVRPWPWTINFEGQAASSTARTQVLDAVQAFQAKGVRSIDVGCMQVNLMHHPNAFSDLEKAFDPAANARYAAKFLNTLYAKTRIGPRDGVVPFADPDRGEEYQRLVFGVGDAHGRQRRRAAARALISVGLTAPGPRQASAMRRCRRSTSSSAHSRRRRQRWLRLPESR